MDNIKEEKLIPVIEVRYLTESVFIIRFERNGIKFKAGQYLVLGTEHHPERREYSIYSPVQADYFEVLVQLVDEASFSYQLSRLQPGDLMYVRGPFGSFNLEESYATDQNFFIATGTGIAPFHSMVLTHSGFDFKILHGVRLLEEGYERNTYPNGHYIQCTSGDSRGDFQGRVTDYLRRHKPEANAHYYLCGNSAMVDEVWNLLKAANVPYTSIHAEIYF